MTNSILIAVGGNSLIRAGQKGTIPEQFANARLTAQSISELAKRGCKLVVTHGNGPQVGAQLLRSEAGSHQTYTMPLDVCVAMTQGEIGYILQTSLQSILKSMNLNIPVAGLVTQVIVDKHDPAFQKPTKPIGPFYSWEIAQKKRDELGWNIVEDAARGYRRVVPSPKPLGIVELEIIKDCLDRDIIVIASGGGGIPVALENGSIVGIEAVIDKDRASSLLASQLGIDKFVISTEVEQVYINFKKPNQQALISVSLNEIKNYLAEGHFLEGSMKPKIEAAIDFLEAGGLEVVITDPEHIVDAIDGKTGTQIKGRRSS
ncbi:MAG: carbamate kinase [Ignavibacteriales bacterium]|nr:carbamate kinase [Ignavibacteriales bacterium]